MKRLKMMLMATIAVLAVGAVGATAAQAGNGSGSITITAPAPAGTASCDFTITHDPWASTGPNSWAAEVTSITPDAVNCTVNDLNIPQACTVVIEKDSSGNATLTGCFWVSTTVTVEIFGIPVEVDVECTYRAKSPGLAGSWAWTGTPFESDKEFDLAGVGEKISPSDLACPGEVTVDSLTATMEYPG